MIGALLGAAGSIGSMGQNLAFNGANGIERAATMAQQEQLAAQGREETLMAARLKNEQERTKVIAELSHVGPNAASKAAESMAR